MSDLFSSLRKSPGLGLQTSALVLAVFRVPDCLPDTRQPDTQGAIKVLGVGTGPPYDLPKEVQERWRGRLKEWTEQIRQAITVRAVMPNGFE